MSDRDDDNNKEESGNQPEDNWNRNENLFSEFEEDADYEDSDRDSDFAAIYSEVDEDEDLEALDELNEFLAGVDRALTADGSHSASTVTSAERVR